MKPHLFVAACTAVLSMAAAANAGLFDKRCADTCDTDCCPPATCCPSDYRCEVEVSTEPIEKSCYNVDTEAVCIPPITSSPFDCFRKKLFRNDCCDSDLCCDDACDSCAPNLFSCFFNKGCGKIRCVNKLSKEKYECGEKCVCEWSAVPVCGDGCGEACLSGPAACCPSK